MFVSCNKYLGSAWTRHYKRVNYPELTSNQFGEKNPSWTSPLRLLFITGLSFRPWPSSVIKPWHILDFQTNSWELASPSTDPDFTRLESRVMFHVFHELLLTVETPARGRNWEFHRQPFKATLINT